MCSGVKIGNLAGVVFSCCLCSLLCWLSTPTTVIASLKSLLQFSEKTWFHAVGWMRLCVCVWLPPKLVPTTCCLLRFIALSSNDALAARHAKTAGCSPRWGAKRKGRKERDTYLSQIPMILFTQNKSFIWFESAKLSLSVLIVFRNVRWDPLNVYCSLLPRNHLSV